MSSVTADRPAGHERVATHGLRATNWPLRENPATCLAWAAFCLSLAVVAGWISQSVTMGMLSALVLVLATWKLWVPVTTEFEPRGIVLTTLGRSQRIAWRDIDHLELHEAGVFLCTQPVRLPRGATNSLFLPWGNDRSSIAAFCQQYHPQYCTVVAANQAGPSDVSD